MKKITKSFLNWLPAITLGIVLGSFLQLTQAWQEPGSNPPNSNIGAPVNTGNKEQYKTGALAVEGILRGWNMIQTMDELCFGWDCRSDWQDLYKSGDNICIESGGCVDVTDNYIGNSRTHYAGGSIDMNNNWITDVRTLKVGNIYDEGGGSWINFHDHIDMNNRVIYEARRVRVTDTWPNNNDELATKRYVDRKVTDSGEGCSWSGWKEDRGACEPKPTKIGSYTCGGSATYVRMYCDNGTLTDFEMGRCCSSWTYEAH
jgi:hypothetical protein